MSECVVRMEIPKNCWVCPFGLDGYIWNENDAGTHYVRFCSRHSGEEFHVLETDTIDRPWFCDSFICSLPEGHGDLINREYAIGTACSGLTRTEDGEKWIGVREVRESIKSAPTIVPAEIVPTIPDPLPIRGVEYVPTEVDVKTGIVTYELRGRSENK